MGVYIKEIGLPEYGECYVIESNGIVLNIDNRCVGIAEEIEAIDERNKCDSCDYKGSYFAAVDLVKMLADEIRRSEDDEK